MIWDLYRLSGSSVMDLQFWRGGFHCSDFWINDLLRIRGVPANGAGCRLLQSPSGGALEVSRWQPFIFYLHFFFKWPYLLIGRYDVERWPSHLDRPQNVRLADWLPLNDLLGSIFFFYVLCKKTTESSLYVNANASKLKYSRLIPTVSQTLNLRSSNGASVCHPWGTEQLDAGCVPCCSCASHPSVWGPIWQRGSSWSEGPRRRRQNHARNQGSGQLHHSNYHTRHEVRGSAPKSWI